ncbi:MAG: PilZ domain-containing protein [Spirochaetes bacterium]|nr:PilZ domain-containing protein [Spirochaetota bacterium]
MDERRKYERLNLSGKVKTTDIDVTKGINVSVGGIRIILDKEMALGEKMEIEFLIPGNPNKFIANGIVVWQKQIDEGYDTGLEFQNIKVIRKDDLKKG